MRVGTYRLVKDVLEPGAVAEAAELEAEARAVAAVLRARDVGDISQPAARVAPAHEPLALAAADRGRVFVTVIAGSRVVPREQPLPALVGAGPIEHEHGRPALADRPLGAALDVRVLRLGERHRLH